MSDWKKYVFEGFPVIWSTSPGSADEFTASVVAVDDNTVDALVWSSQGGSAISGNPRHGLRHTGDELWKDAERTANVIQDNDSGCFRPHPLVVALVDGIEALQERVDVLEERQDQAALVAAPDAGVIELPPIAKNRGKLKPKKDDGPPSPAAFRTEALPELTDEQKQANAEALAAAGA